MIQVFYRTKANSTERVKSFSEIDSYLEDLWTQPDIIIFRVIVNGTGFTPKRFEDKYFKE